MVPGAGGAPSVCSKKTLTGKAARASAFLPHTLVIEGSARWDTDLAFVPFFWLGVEEAVVVVRVKGWTLLCLPGFFPVLSSLCLLVLYFQRMSFMARKYGFTVNIAHNFGQFECWTPFNMCQQLTLLFFSYSKTNQLHFPGPQNNDAVKTLCSRAEINFCLEIKS